MPILLLLASLCAPSTLLASDRDVTAAEPVYYLIADTTPLRAAPDRTAPTLRKLKQYELVAGREIFAGWLRVDGHEHGWIAIARENIVTGPLQTLRRRLFRVQAAKWPDAVKRDVARGRIRHGFTADQVRLALGDPLSATLEGSGNTLGEAWTYPDRRVLFSQTGVRAIEPLTGN